MSRLPLNNLALAEAMAQYVPSYLTSDMIRYQNACSLLYSVLPPDEAKVIIEGAEAKASTCTVIEILENEYDKVLRGEYE